MDIKDDIINRLSIFKNFYDEIRIVDPFKSSLELIRNNGTSSTCDKCFMTLGKSAPCSNCISARAYFSDDTIIKYDTKHGKPVTIIAAPVVINGQKHIVEIIKHISKDQLLSSGMSEENILDQIFELNYKVVHDELTNLYNRRYIDEQLDKAINSSYKNKINMSIIMCDIDHFKNINDTYGHQCGDTILKTFANIVKDKAEDCAGWAGRYGGEEFLCLIPGRNADDTCKIAEDMRLKFEACLTKYKSAEVKATASFGIASTDIDKKTTSDDLIQIADDNLYKVKESGRNSVAK